MLYKIKVFKHNSIKAKIEDDFLKVIAYFKAHNIDLILDIKDTDVIKGSAFTKLMQPNDGTCDVVMYLYDRYAFPQGYGLSFSVSPTLRGILLATSLEDDAVDYTWKIMCHEIMHTFFYKYNINQLDPMDRMLVNGVWLPYYKNDNPNATDGNFAQAWKNLTPYLNQYKYFKANEIVGLKPELVLMLDKAREIAGIPFVINSGLRTVGNNEDVGGVADSSHLRGLAVDLRARNSNEHGLITRALYLVGFTRISKKYTTHIHCDIDPDKPQNVLF